MYVVVEAMGVCFSNTVMVILPAGLFGAAIASFSSTIQGIVLNPIYQQRMKAGLVFITNKEEFEMPLPKGAKLSVARF